MEAVTLEEALKLATKYKALVLKWDGLEIHMSSAAFAAPDAQDSAAPAIGAEHGNPTDEELLLWSAGGALPKIKATPPEAE